MRDEITYYLGVVVSQMFSFPVERINFTFYDPTGSIKYGSSKDPEYLDFCQKGNKYVYRSVSIYTSTGVYAYMHTCLASVPSNPLHITHYTVTWYPLQSNEATTSGTVIVTKQSSSNNNDNVEICIMRLHRCHSCPIRRRCYHYRDSITPNRGCSSAAKGSKWSLQSATDRCRYMLTVGKPYLRALRGNRLWCVPFQWRECQLHLFRL